MHCDQIRPLLKDYRKGALPGYRSAWVVQHLAGCPDCRLAADHPISVPAPTPAGAPSSAPLQRPVPVWALGAASTAMGLALAGLAWMLSSSWQNPRPAAPATAPPPLAALAPAPVEPGSEPLPDYTATMQEQSGVTLRILGATRADGRISLEARFQGEGLLPPGETTGWITVSDEGLRPLAVQIDGMLSDRTGLTVLLSFPVPQGGDRFTLRFSGVPRLTVFPFSLPLPDPPPVIEQVVRPLSGSPAGIVLMNYGTAGDLLHVWLRFPGYLSADDAEFLFLADSGAVGYAPVRAEPIRGVGADELLLQYPIPRVLRPPLSLRGKMLVQKLLGPWRIDARLITS